MSRLVISPDHLQTVQRHAMASYPDECCGVLIGRSLGDSTVVERLLSVGNERQDSRHNRYLISPETIARGPERGAVRSASTSWVIITPTPTTRPGRANSTVSTPGRGCPISSCPCEGRQVVDTRSWRLQEDRASFDEEVIDQQRWGAAQGGGLMGVTIRSRRRCAASPGSRRRSRSPGRRSARRSPISTAPVPGAAPHLYQIRRRRKAAQLRQHLRQRRRHPLSAGRGDAGRPRGDTLLIVPSIAGGCDRHRRAAPRALASTRSGATAATSSCPRSAARGSASSRPPRCSASAPAGSARRSGSTSPRPASARSASSISTSSTSATCSARSFIRPVDVGRPKIAGGRPSACATQSARRHRPARDRA